jgi:1,4-dihydroxy-2-naphthoate octaprenyltransferase
MAITAKAFAGVARVPFLLLPVTLVAAGAAAGAYEGSFDWSRTALALVGLVALHAAVNALNEASDMRRGIDLHTRRTPFSGGSGTLPSGALSWRGALLFGLAAAALGLVIGLVLLAAIGWPLVPFMVLGAVSVLAYSDVCARLGLGELLAGLGLGFLPVAGTALVQGGQFGATATAAGIPAFCMTFNLLLLNEFPDEEADRTGGRRNLVLLLGRRNAAAVYSLVGLLAPLSLVLAWRLDWMPSIALVALVPSLMLVPPLRWALVRPQEDVPIRALASNVAWNLATNSLLAVALFAAAQKS